MPLRKFDIVRKTKTGGQQADRVQHTINREAAAEAFMHLRELNPNMPPSEIYEKIAEEARTQGAVRMLRGGLIKTRIEKLVQELEKDLPYLESIKHIKLSTPVKRKGEEIHYRLNAKSALEAFLHLRRRYSRLDIKRFFSIIATAAREQGLLNIKAETIERRIGPKVQQILEDRAYARSNLLEIQREIQTTVLVEFGNRLYKPGMVNAFFYLTGVHRNLSGDEICQIIAKEMNRQGRSKITKFDVANILNSELTRIKDEVRAEALEEIKRLRKERENSEKQ